MTPELVALHVAAAFGCPVEVLHRPYLRSAKPRTNTPRSVYVYMLVQYLPKAERLRGRGPSGGWRKPRSDDGNIRPVARLMKTWPAAIRYHLRRVEDLRDDPTFDAKVSAIEAALDVAGASR